MIIFFPVLYHNDTWIIPKLTDSVCNLVISGNEVIIITMISRYFQVLNNIDEKFVKNFCYSLIFCNIITMIGRYFQVWNNIDEKFVKNFCCNLTFRNYFFSNYFLLTFLGDNFFLISVILDFVFILSVKSGFTVFQTVLLSVMSIVLILLKKFFFSLLIKLTQRLRCLLYALLSMSLFVFKSLFLRPLHDFFIYLFIYERRLIRSNIPLFYGSMSLNSFIKSCFKSIKLKIIVLRRHLNNTIFNVKHKRFIRKVFIIPIRHNIWFLFLIEYFHYC